MSGHAQNILDQIRAAEDDERTPEEKEDKLQERADELEEELEGDGAKIGEEATVMVDLDERGIADIELIDGVDSCELKEIMGAPVLTIQGDPDGEATVAVRGDGVESFTSEVQEVVDDQVRPDGSLRRFACEACGATFNDRGDALACCSRGIEEGDHDGE